MLGKIKGYRYFEKNQTKFEKKIVDFIQTYYLSDLSFDFDWMLDLLRFH